MVTSLSEECSALRQEVSYLRNVRQEKKRAWNKLQCFIMDAERKLKGNERKTTSLREVIRDLGQMIATSESSTLDETVLYMYSNQLEWIEKMSMGCESFSDPEICNEITSESCFCSHINQNEKPVCIGVSTQTTMDSQCDEIIKDNGFSINRDMSDIAIQTEIISCMYDISASSSFESPLSEISREIYVVPEALEECDFCVNSASGINQVNDVAVNIHTLHNADHSSSVKVNHSSECQKVFIDSHPNLLSNSELSTAVIPLSGSFGVDLPCVYKKKKFVFPFHNIKTDFPFLSLSDVSEPIHDIELQKLQRRQIDNTFKFLNDAGIFLSLFLNQNNISMAHLHDHAFYAMLMENVKSVEIFDHINNWSCIVLNPGEFPISPISFNQSVRCLPYEFCSGLDTTESSLTVGKISSKIENTVIQKLGVCSDVTSSLITENSLYPSVPNELDLLPNINSDNEVTFCDDYVSGFTIVDAHTADNNLIISNKDNSFENISGCSNNIEGDFTLERSGTFVCEKSPVFEKPVTACREGTFIIDSSKKIQLKETKTCDESVYCTAMLTALISNETNKTEKNYVLYEVCNAVKNSTVFLPSINPHFVSNFEDKETSGQHFILCEAVIGDEHENSPTFSTKISCHIILYKANVKEDIKSLVEKPLENISEFYPLLPQYLPSENCDFSDFEQFSLAHSCEIYMCNRNRCKIENDFDNTAFIPKNYFKFKELFPAAQSNGNFLSQDSSLCQNAFKHNLIPTFSASFEENCDINLNDMKVNHEKDLSEITNYTDFTVENAEKETQTDDTSFTEENQLEIFSDGILGREFEISQDIISESELGLDISIIKMKNEIQLSSIQPSQEQVLKEKGLLDEIEALKDNLEQQNAVLMRLKEELEESNFRLAEKEQLLVILQLEHSRLTAILTESGVKEIDEKECQTEFIQDVSYEALEKEIFSLRQKNLQHYEKIVFQNNTIQSVKSQLCATISHLKHLKDAATKQLKKQKHHILKSLKLKQQLHDIKVELQKKNIELEKKNEILSDQEFHLHEIQAQLDSAVEIQKNAKLSRRLLSKCITVDYGCQTEATKIHNFGEQQTEISPQNQILDVTLKKHSEELLVLQSKFHHLESVLTNRKEHRAHSDEATNNAINEMKLTSNLKEGNIWKMLTISEQSYLSLLNKLSESLQITDLKGSSALMHTSWLSCDDLADARRQDHKKILQSLEKMKRSIRYLQENLNLESKRQNAGSTPTDEKRPNFMCHSEEMHFQYLCEVLQKAQENLVKEYSQKRSSHRTVVTAGSGRTSRHTGSRERRIPLELKNGRILALLDDKLSQKELLPNKFDYNKMEYKSGNSSSKSKTPS